jgi:hypothetical protein
MKIGLTEKQYKHILSKLLEQSEAEPVKAEPEAGTSSTQSGGTGYPQVGKWESGITRGPANQVGVTKWSDVVGSKLTRSKANQLKEQVIGSYYTDKFSGIPENGVVTKHEAMQLTSLLLGLVPHPAFQLASSGVMLYDATLYDDEGDPKAANLMRIFAVMGGLGAVKSIPFVKEMGIKGMALLGKKLSQGTKLLPKENAIIKKIIENKDIITQQLKRLSQTKVPQKVNQIATKYKNSKFNNSFAGDLTKTIGLYGGTKLAQDSYYYDLYPEDLAKHQKAVLDARKESIKRDNQQQKK